MTRPNDLAGLHPTSASTAPILSAGFRVRDVAVRLCLDHSRVLRLIRAGQLRAINVAMFVGTKARWRILPEDLAAFELRRAAGPQAKVTRCRRRQQGVTEFF